MGTPRIEVTSEFMPGIGWQYAIHRDGVLFGRYGSFETEAGALHAGNANAHAHTAPRPSTAWLANLTREQMRGITE